MTTKTKIYIGLGILLAGALGATVVTSMNYDEERRQSERATAPAYSVHAGAVICKDKEAIELVELSNDSDFVDNENGGLYMRTAVDELVSDGRCIVVPKSQAEGSDFGYPTEWDWTAPLNKDAKAMARSKANSGGRGAYHGDSSKMLSVEAFTTNGIEFPSSWETYPRYVVFTTSWMACNHRQGS
jgi:hypothetical protein